MTQKVAVFVGSLRKESYSKKIANNIIDLLPEVYEAEIVRFDQLPFYNQEFDEAHQAPEVVQKFRTHMKDFDAVIFVTPEYNRSIPGSLKNALDIGSRPKPENVWNNKPALVVSNSPGNISGFGANHHLRQILTSLNMPTVQQPEVYLAGVANFFDASGQITDENTVAFLQSAVDAFTHLVDRLAV